MRVDDDKSVTSPGVRMAIDVVHYSTSTKTRCKIDITPSVQFDNWPAEAKSKRPKWIPDDIWDQARANYHMVPKLHYSGVSSELID